MKNAINKIKSLLDELNIIFEMIAGQSVNLI